MRKIICYLILVTDYNKNVILLKIDFEVYFLLFSSVVFCKNETKTNVVTENISEIAFKSFLTKILFLK